ncbi:MAG: hypothetical protein CVV24_14860 [Ignavibacteriae bacterium HGW-Ignavibacteriae-3]|nr:MAG: hypothetical protein CVV24_14860 [Ignavibacteriae bacterium HGW-Ignavibacteriae-3]
MQPKNNLVGVVLAGGEGVRLQKYVQRLYGYPRPKQYCAFTGSRSMFRHTIDRTALLIPHDKIFTVVNTDHSRYVEDESLNNSSITILEQPCLRDTAAGILFPLLKIKSINPESTVAIFPSDHFILNEERFMEHISKAEQFVDENPKFIVTLGLRTEKFETGYGWIEPTRDVYSDGTTKIFNVKRFIEKPDHDLADTLLNKGCLINTFVMVGKCSAFIKHISFCLPELMGAFKSIRNNLGTPLENIMVRRLYKYLPSFNFSTCVLQNIPEYLHVMEVTDVYWSDWGDEKRITSDLMTLTPAYNESLLAM